MMRTPSTSNARRPRWILASVLFTGIALLPLNVAASATAATAEEGACRSHANFRNNSGSAECFNGSQFQVVLTCSGMGTLGAIVRPGEISIATCPAGTVLEWASWNWWA